MAAESKKSKKETPETKKSGSCGQTLGCLIMIAAIIAVVIYFIIKPKIDESEFSFESIGQWFSEKKDDWFNKAEDIKQKADDHLEEAKDGAEDALDRSRDAVDNVREQTESSVKNPPKLISDEDKDSLKKTNIKIYE